MILSFYKSLFFILESEHMVPHYWSCIIVNKIVLMFLTTGAFIEGILSVNESFLEVTQDKLEKLL